MRNGGKWTEARYFSFIKSALRRASSRWPPKYAVLNNSFTEKKINPSSGRLAKFHRCAKCNGEFTAKDMEVNHIVPVIPISGFDSWDGLIERLFCEEDGLEALCRPCHKILTKEENIERKQYNDKRSV